MGRILILAASVAALLALGACTPSAESAQQAGVTTRTAMQDNVSAWRGLFEYHPKDRRPLLPQTRYCYQTQADIVCYDSPQPNLNSKLYGYQDGQSISWVQPGGGSLGVSGGEATAPHDAQTVQVAPTLMDEATAVNLQTPIVVETTQAPANAPFASGESVYVKP